MGTFLFAIVLGALGASQSSSLLIGFPEECGNILNNAVGGVTYPPNSTANSFNTFCPVINEFTDCLEQNLDILRNNGAPVYRILADNFDKDAMRFKMLRICHEIPAIATQLDCIPKDEVISECMDQHQGQFLQSNLTLKSLCNTISSVDTCLRKPAGVVCPNDVDEFLIQYQKLFIPACSENPITSTNRTTVKIVSVFLNCIAESFPALVPELVQTKENQPAQLPSIIYESFEDICRNRTVFAECVKERFVPPLSAFDAIIDTFLNQNAIGTALDLLCGVPISSTENSCLQDSMFGMVLCGRPLTSVDKSIRHMDPTGFSSTTINPGFIANASGAEIPPATVTHAPPDYTSKFCPAVHAINTCVRIQLQRCSTQLGQTFMDVERQLLTPQCISAVSPVIEISPFYSVFLYCGLPLAVEIFEGISSINSTGPQRDQDTIEMVKSLIPGFCKFAPTYASCLAREIVNSDNLLDKIALKFYDLTDGNRLQTIATEICDQMSEIQDKLECLRDNFLTIGMSCVADPKFIADIRYYSDAVHERNFAFLNTDDIRELCGPLKKSTLCAARLMSKCSEELTKTGETVINEILRTDCGGTRPLTGNPNKGPRNDPQISIIFLFLSLSALLNLI